MAELVGIPDEPQFLDEAAGDLEDGCEDDAVIVDDDEARFPVQACDSSGGVVGLCDYPRKKPRTLRPARGFRGGRRLARSCRRPGMLWWQRGGGVRRGRTDSGMV